MEYQNSYLLKYIEKMRKELIKLGSIKPLFDPEVVKFSQRLDKLLNEYEYQKVNK